jgi:hypothetical protein
LEYSRSERIRFRLVNVDSNTHFISFYGFGLDFTETRGRVFVGEDVIPEALMPQEPRLQCGFSRSRNLSSNVLITCTSYRIVYLVGAWPREINQVGFGLANYINLGIQVLVIK